MSTFSAIPRSGRCSAGLVRQGAPGGVEEAGIDEYVRPFHDLRHSSLTNEAAAGSNPIALMTKAGHSSMATTRIYLHLAGQVFRAEADALEQRLFGGRTFYPSEPISDDLPSPAMAQQQAAAG